MCMHFVIDLRLVALIALSAIRHYKLGFVCSVLTAGKFIVAIALAALFRAPVAELILKVFFADTENTAVSGMLSGMISFVLIFATVMVIAGLIIRAISNIKIPIITDFDKWIGLALGVVIGIVTASLLSTAIYSVLEFTSAANGSPDVMNAYNNSFVFKLIYDMKVFEFIRNLI